MNISCGEIKQRKAGLFNRRNKISFTQEYWSIFENDQVLRSHREVKDRIIIERENPTKQKQRMRMSGITVEDMLKKFYRSSNNHKKTDQVKIQHKLQLREQQKKDIDQFNLD